MSQHHGIDVECRPQHLISPQKSQTPLWYSHAAAQRYPRMIVPLRINRD